MTSILQIIEDDAKALWGDVVAVEQAVVSRIENGILTLWNLFKGSVGKLTADEAALLNSFVKIAVADIGTGDIAAVETAVLNLAKAAGAAFVADLGSPMLQAFIGLVLSAVPPQAPAAAAA